MSRRTAKPRKSGNRRCAHQGLARDLLSVGGSARDYDTLIGQIGEERFALLGEASHGTHEFYRERAEITKRLITERNFTAVAVEADWPNAYRVNRYVRGASEDVDAVEALADFRSFTSSAVPSPTLRPSVSSSPRAPLRDAWSPAKRRGLSSAVLIPECKIVALTAVKLELRAGRMKSNRTSIPWGCELDTRHGHSACTHVSSHEGAN